MAVRYRCSPKICLRAQPDPPSSLPALLRCRGGTHHPHPDLAGAARAAALPAPPSGSVPADPGHSGATGSVLPPSLGTVPGTTGSSRLSPQRGGGHRRVGCAYHHPAAPGGIASAAVGVSALLARALTSLPGQATAEGSGRWGAKLWHPPGSRFGVQSCPPPPSKPLLGGSWTPPSPHTLTAAEPPLPDGAGATPHRREPEPTAGRASRHSLL